MEGEKEYSIDCTGDCVIGDEVLFERAVFTGTYPNSKFDYMETVRAKILKDSYGKAKKQHTFTLLDIDIEQDFRIKGRNLYRNGIKRKPWADEEQRRMFTDEKHDRGNIAREERRIRKEQNY